MVKRISRYAAAFVIYTGFAVYLYQPYFEKFSNVEYFFVVNVIVAAMGSFILSRRWVISFVGSFFAGALYGFGPFMLGLGRFHPLAGLLASCVPWLFLPAVFGPKGRLRIFRVPLAVMPFVVIVLFFEITTRFHIFAVPINAKLNLKDLFALAAPLVAVKRNLTAFGFYHVPIGALAMGFAMLLAVKRTGVIVVLCLGTALALFGPLLNVSSVIWLSIPMLCCSVIIGEGTAGFISAGHADRKWLLSSTILLMILAIVNLLLATRYFQVFFGLADGYARLFVQTGVMYIVGAVSIGIVFFVTRTGLRVHWLRWTVLTAALAVDVFLGATFLVDLIF